MQLISFAGKSRSVSIVMAYLIVVKGMKAVEALDFIKKKRPIVQPQESFVAALKTLELNTK
jgi:protein-tyrosine phosphatase